MENTNITVIIKNETDLPELVRQAFRNYVKYRLENLEREKARSKEPNNDEK